MTGVVDSIVAINYQIPAQANSLRAARDFRGPDCDQPDPLTNARG